LKGVPQTSFVVDEDATVEINGGSPFVYVLNEGLLEDLRRETLPFTTDMSAVEGCSIS